jgi:probable phosphoglycerate mutase
MKYFLIIRHGRPDENYALCPGDPPLDPQGMEHAVSLAEKLVNEGIDRIVSSPQRRAIDTATPLSKLLDLEIEIFEGLAEVDYRSTKRYRSIETMRQEESAESLARFMASPIKFYGHDPEVFMRNVSSTYRRIFESDKGQRIAVFTHGVTTKTFISAVLGLPEIRYGKFHLNHCSVTRLSGESFDTVRLDSLNETLAIFVK